MGGIPGKLGSGRLEVDTGGKDVVEVVGGVGAINVTMSVLVAAPGGPFWFPSGPGGPFLFPSRPGAVGFAGSRTVRGSGKGGGLVGL